MATSFEKLETVEKRYLEIESLMAQPEVISDLQRLQALAKERASLEDQVAMYRSYKKVTQAIADTNTIIEEEKDEELIRMAREELETLTSQLGILEEKLKLALLPQDPNDGKDVIVEIRGGAGGEEAALFAGDLFRMYSLYAERKKWQTELISQSESGIGGFKEVIFEVKGRGAYSRLKYESGVHRVQRVPETESSGRIHTSTATVAVLPEMEDVDVDINPDDLRIDIYHASGHGGQNVQKVATAVRITHLPTGMVVTCQDERSQLKNKLKAMAVLRARLYDMKQREQQEKITETRRSQVGTGDRSEKVSTYNFPQDRLSDHRINFTTHGLPRIMEGDLDSVIDALTAEEQSLKLAAALG